MNYKLFIGIILCLWMHYSYAQTLKGTVYDAQTKEPLIAAKIQLLNTDKFALTNNQGDFELAITGENSFIIISALGYESKQFSTTLEKFFNIPLKSKNSQLQEVIVTANREAGLRTKSPISISKLSSKIIEETKPIAVYEVLNKVPGVLMVNLNNEQHAMAIRQPMTTSNYFLYMEDGLGIRPMGIFNHNALLEINQFAISSIEVVKGPVSSIYGPEAVGGVVNFITQRPTIVPTIRLGIQADQWGYKRIQLGAGAKTGKFGFYIGGLTSKQNDSWMPSSDYYKSVANTRLEYHFSKKTRLIGTFMYADYHSQTNGNIDSIAFYNRKYISISDFTYRKSKASRSRLTLEKDWNANSRSFFTVFHRFNQLGQNPAYGIRWSPLANSATATGEINSNNFTSFGGLAQHSQDFKLLNSKLLVGGMYDYSPNDYHSYQIDLAAQLRLDGKSVEKYTITQERPDIKLADYNAKIRNAALYAQYDFTPLQKLIISTGLRYDLLSFSYNNYLDKASGSKKYQQLTPKIGLTYDLGNDKGLYLNYSLGFAPPALTTIFRKRPDTNDFYYNLQPAQFKNFEVGGWASLIRNKVYLDLALYLLKGKNELLNIRQADNSFDYQSAGETLHRGIELGITVKPNQEFIFRWGGTLALHRFEDFKISDKQTDEIKNLNGFKMPSAPRQTCNTEISWYPKNIRNFRASLEWQYVSGWYQNQINTIKYKGYNLLNSRFGYQYKNIELYCNVINLTDALYATNATKGNNATDRTNFTPAAPRTFVIGLQYNITSKNKKHNDI